MKGMSSQDRPDRATPLDWAHFQTVAAAERESEEERIEAALTTTPGERVLAGFRLARGAPWTSAHLAEADAQADGQMELARRRLALGLNEGPAR
jgi:hypothetical protein